METGQLWRVSGAGLAVLAALLFFPPSAAASPACGRATFSVAGWNVDGSRPVVGPKVERLADGLLALDADMIVLSELAPDAAIEALSNALSTRGLEYEYVLLEQSSPENVALLYKPWVELREAELVPGSDDGKGSLRKALAVRARAGDFDFILVGVYLRSGRDPSAATTRARQASAIARFLDRRLAETKEDDALLVGDFNMDPGREREGFEALAMGGRLRFLSSEELRGDITHIRRCRPRSGLLLDGFAVTREAGRKYIGGSLRVVPMNRFLGLSCEDYLREVSDQLPIVGRFRILGDQN